MPEGGTVEELREPIAECHILVPPGISGQCHQALEERRGVQKDMLFLGKQVSLTYEVPFGRSGDGLLRSPEIHLARLCLAGLHLCRFEASRAGARWMC
jgi:hypothetical protein